MRKGIALIELIFAIVVIAITLLSVPNLMQQTSKASSQVVTQESISSAASQINMIMSLFWDENATNPKYNNPVLVVKQSNPSLIDANITMGGMSYSISRRLGSPKSSPRRFAVNINGKKLTATPATKLGIDINDAGEMDDVDDYNGATSKLQDFNNTSIINGDYKDTSIDMNTTVYYIDDNPTNFPPMYKGNSITFNDPFNPAKITNKSTNIKAIQIKLTSTNNKDLGTVTLKAFSCNIGSSKLKERTF